MTRFRIAFVFFILSIIILHSYSQNTKGQLVDDIPSPGALNAIKKAYQMTDLCFIPLDSFIANPEKTYYGGISYQGLVYSSVKEAHTFVGIDVSFHTFMTALHNPRSVLYTENVSEPPFHGTNCGAYYGTVCSGLVTYALGLNVYIKSYDFADSDKFHLVKDQSSKGVRLVDVIHSRGHVQLVTGIKRDSRSGKAVEIEICEGVRSGCRRVILTGKELERQLSKGKRKLFRYNCLDSVEYSPMTDFVAVGDEKLTPFKYNDDICTSRGDKACYIAGDSVVFNIAKGFEILEIYKEAELFKRIPIGGRLDVVVKELPYGDYKARVVNGKKSSVYTYWKIIDAHARLDTKNMKVFFYSANATPIYLDFSSQMGGRPTKGVFEFTEEDQKRGWIDVSSYMSLGNEAKHRLVKVHFECEYGRVTNKPVKWNKKR